MNVMLVAAALYIGSYEDLDPLTPGIQSVAARGAHVIVDLGGGDYLLEGMKFSMRGYWTLSVKVDAGGIRDVANFELVLE